MTLETRSPLELAGAVHARVRLFARVAAPVGFEVGEAGEVTATAVEGAAVAFATRGFYDDGLRGGWGRGCMGGAWGCGGVEGRGECLLEMLWIWVGV